VAQIAASGKLVFHSVGDTGGIVRAEPQLAISDALVADLAGKTYATGLPAFLFHLGFLRITASAGSILVESLGIHGTPATTTPGTPIPPPILIDSFSVDLAKHTVTTLA
jgi:hypothetical protein